MPALAKLDDMVLAARFVSWYTPRLKQAGAQKGRGCEEQILSVRLLIDIAKKTRKELYECFMDYQKAYDRVNRNRLLCMLDKKGCGTRYLRAIGESLKQSTGIIGDLTFGASSGVRQGACTSCPLFTYFVDETVQAVS